MRFIVRVEYLSTVIASPLVNHSTIYVHSRTYEMILDHKTSLNISYHKRGNTDYTLLAKIRDHILLHTLQSMFAYLPV